MNVVRGRLGVASAISGGALWAVVPWLPFGSPPTFASLEHVLLFALLVNVPLAMDLVTRLLASPAARIHALAQWIQLPAGLLVTASFCLPAGRTAGILAGGWLAISLAFAAGSVRSIRPLPGPALSNFSLLAAHLMLPVGAVWLLLARLGTGPARFSALTVLLAATHFHQSGFLFGVLLSATGRSVTEARAIFRGVHRLAAIAAVVGIVLIAAGNAAGVLAVKSAGVATMVLAGLAFATSTARVARDARGSARALLGISSASLVAGIALAAIYGAGEFVGRIVIDVPTMARLHGLVLAVGFTLCGLVGQTFARARVTRSG